MDLPLETINWPYMGLRDPVSAGTHFLALAMAIGAAIVLWRACRGEWRARMATLVFSASMILLYTASATYHALQLPPDRLRVFQRLDHSAVFVLIAGSYMPPVILLVRSTLRRRAYVVIVWAFAIAGISLQWLLPQMPYLAEIIIYFSMGWLAVFMVRDLTRAIEFHRLRWLLAGGVFYTMGGIADLLRWPVFYAHVFNAHELFHVLTALGTMAHVCFFVFDVVPRARSRAGASLDPGAPGPASV